MGAGELDMAMNFAAALVIALDLGAPIVLLGGVHAGCFDLFGAEGVCTISNLKGKTVAMLGKGVGAVCLRRGHRDLGRSRPEPRDQLGRHERGRQPAADRADRKSTRLNSSHERLSRMPSSA